jgi:PAS domain S-box-containing protein
MPLFRQEAPYRILTDVIGTSPLAFLLAGPAGNIIEANQKACELFGYSEEEFCRLGRSDLVNMKDTSVIKLLEHREKAGKATGKLKMRKKSGDYLLAEVSSHTILDKYTGKSYTVTIISDITAEAGAWVSLQETNQQLKDLSSHLRNAREEERRKLAREVHDELGQLASVIKMHVDWLRLRMPDFEEPFRNRITLASNTADMLISGIRRIATDLRPGLLDDLGLNASLEWKCRKYEKEFGILCEFSTTLDDRGMDNTLKTELYRICQEAMANARLHGLASSITVQLHETNDAIQLYIIDNGKGFNRQETDSRKMGLIGMEECCSSLGGTLTISSEPGEGTIIAAVIPKKQ